jgi:hypothetical protein
MKPDPIVDEVRKARQAHAAKFNHDMKAIFADLKQKEKACGHRIVSRPSRLRLKKTGS